VRGRRDAPVAVLLHAALVLGALVALGPMLWMLAASFMPAGEATSATPRFWPSAPTLEHYRALFTRLDLGRYVLNSAIVALAVTGVSIFVNSAAGYAFAKLRFRGRRALWALLTAGLVVPVQVVMLPNFLIMKQLGLVNTYGGVMIPTFASIFGIFLVRQYAASFPDELLDAARMDGASELRIYFSVVLPVIRPILATLAIWTFLTTWNDFMWPLIILTDETRYTLPVALAGLVGERAQDTELMMAGSVLTVLPVLVVFLALQRYYVQGITVGSVKG
jgi:multiple sugar transport system permease protein